LRDSFTLVTKRGVRNIKNNTLYFVISGPGRSVGTATSMGCTVRGSNSGGARFFAHVQTGPGAHPCTMGTGSFPGAKLPGSGADHPPPSNAEVENE
jgi:hypothetical protein